MFKLSNEGIEFVKNEIKRYETKQSAVIPCLYRIQDENGGWVSPESVSYLSQLMKISESNIYEVLSFYTMFNKKPVGPIHIQVCCNISCAMTGARELLTQLQKEFPSKDTKNPTYTITPVECLGSCDTAPVVQINKNPYIEHAKIDDLKDLIKNKIKIEKNSKIHLS